MSKFLQPCKYKGRALENQLRNCFYGIHDLMCGCDTIEQHIHQLICSPKCLPSITTENGENHGQEEDVIVEGDLDALFAASDDAAG